MEASWDRGSSLRSSQGLSSLDSDSFVRPHLGHHQPHGCDPETRICSDVVDTGIMLVDSFKVFLCMIDSIHAFVIFLTRVAWRVC